jgi:hypothetical protein
MRKPKWTAPFPENRARKRPFGNWTYHKLDTYQPSLCDSMIQTGQQHVYYDQCDIFRPKVANLYTTTTKSSSWVLQKWNDKSRFNPAMVTAARPEPHRHRDMVGRRFSGTLMSRSSARSEMEFKMYKRWSGHVFFDVIIIDRDTV